MVSRSASVPGNELVKLKDLAKEADTSYRFLHLEIRRGRLTAIRLSPTALRVRRSDWEAYLNARATMPSRT